MKFNVIKVSINKSTGELAQCSDVFLQIAVDVKI